MTKTTTRWYVVADGARARILARNGRSGPLEPVAQRNSEAARKPTRELGAERPGRSVESVGGARHAMEPPVDWHRFEKQRFAQELAELLARRFLQKRFDELVIVAPPGTLGDLRKSLPAAVRDHVVAEIGKDFTAVALHDLPGHLDEPD